MFVNKSSKIAFNESEKQVDIVGIPSNMDTE
jgi:hypothetical protein